MVEAGFPARLSTALVSRAVMMLVRIATGHPDHAVRLWDTRTESTTVVKRSLATRKSWVSAVAWRGPAQPQQLASACHDGSVQLFLKSMQPCGCRRRLILLCCLPPRLLCRKCREAAAKCQLPLSPVCAC